MNLWKRLPSRASVGLFAGHLVTAGGATLLVLALTVFVYYTGLLVLSGADAGNMDLLIAALLATASGTIIVLRHLVPVVLRALLAGLANLLGFPVMYVRENVWPVYFSAVAAALAYSLGAFWFNYGNTPTLVLLVVALLAGIAGTLYHLLRHRWAGYIGLGIAAVMLATGVVLLQTDALQTAAYNAAMNANAQRQWEVQNQLLDASIAGYERDRRRNQLWELLFPKPQTNLAALAHFHKANGALQSPGKSQEAYGELCRSLMRNPGNRKIGLTPEQAATLEDNARHAQRNIEKLMRSGQDGGAGQPNGKQSGQGQPKQGKQPSRDPGKEPQPGHGRQPRDVL